MAAPPISTRKTASQNINLDVDVDLRAWKQLGHDGSFEGLLQVEAHLRRLAVPVRSPLPLRCTEGGHAVLTVDDGSVVPSPAAGASHLGRQQLVKTGNLARTPTETAWTRPRRPH